jgi:hypothetical protein
MYISVETPEETDRRLRRIAALMEVEVLDGEWWYEELAPDEYPRRVRQDGIALIRGRNGWSQLVPVVSGDKAPERFRVWCCHFPEAADNSGFIGWLASRIKHRTGSGVFVVCGSSAADGGIYDYWGCPDEIAGPVLGELGAIAAGVDSTAPTLESLSLDGVCMRPVAATGHGEVDRETLFSFSQQGPVVSARYSGGAVQLGFLIGTLSEDRLAWRYVQADQAGRLDGGHALCELLRLPDRRVRLTEHFSWDSREGSGSNVLEQIPSES